MNLQSIPIDDYNTILAGINLQHKYHVMQVQESSASIISSLQALNSDLKQEVKRAHTNANRRVARSKKAK
jgi:hypothetical protein